MPNLEGIRRTAERRAARSQKTKENVQAAVDQEAALAELKNRVDREKAGTATEADTDILNALRQRAEQQAKPQRQSRAQRRIEQQITATAQAEADVQRTVAPLDDTPVDLSYYSSRGIEPPLHVLNHMAKQADKAMRDTNRDAASAAGKAVFDVLNDKRPESGRESRNKTVATAMRAMADAKAKQAAKTE